MNPQKKKGKKKALLQKGGQMDSEVSVVRRFNGRFVFTVSWGGRPGAVTALHSFEQS
jgi:hypothetical protein